MSNTKLNPEGVRPPGGNYTHSVEVEAGSTLLYVAGQTGVAPDGSIPDEPPPAHKRARTLGID